MAITNGYATLADLKARLDITSSDTDVMLEQIVEAASRQIDGWCGRAFFGGEGVRYVTADNSCMVILPEDLQSLTELSTDRDDDRDYETVWPVGAIDLQPYPGPYAVIRTRPGHSFPTHRQGVRIEGVWGFAGGTPAVIREACLLQAARLYKRKDAPFGVTGNPEHGQMQTISSIDPDVKEMLKPFVRHWMVV